MRAQDVLDQALASVGGNQAELARRLGRSETTVSRWRNERNGIDMESALRLARLTGLAAREVVAACGLDPQLVPAGHHSASAEASQASDPGLVRVNVAWPWYSAGPDMSSGPLQPQTREHRFEGRAIQLPADLTDAQLDGRACIRCGAEDRPMRPVEAWSEQSAALFECVGAEPCIDNADVWHTAH